jgi:hypothetical protein
MFTEKAAALSGDASCTFHADAIAASQEFRNSYESKLNVVKGKDMPWERSPDGLIKHLVNHQMNTRECCVEAYMQFLKPGERSGKHRHMWEEVIFVVEGSGYDLHWDGISIASTPSSGNGPRCRRSSVKRGATSTFRRSPRQRATTRIAPDRDEQPHRQEMGFDWFDQVENAPGYEAQTNKQGGDCGSLFMRVATWTCGVAAQPSPCGNDARPRRLNSTKAATSSSTSATASAAYDHMPHHRAASRQTFRAIRPSSPNLRARAACGSPTGSQRGAEGRHRRRHHQARHRLRSLLGSRAPRPTGSPGSAAQQRGERLRGWSSGISKLEDTLSKELIVSGTGQAPTPTSSTFCSLACSAQVQDRHRLSGGNDVTLAMGAAR